MSFVLDLDRKRGRVLHHGAKLVLGLVLTVCTLHVCVLCAWSRGHRKVEKRHDALARMQRASMPLSLYPQAHTPPHTLHIHHRDKQDDNLA